MKTLSILVFSLSILAVTFAATSCPGSRPFLQPIAAAITLANIPPNMPCIAACPSGTTSTTASGNSNICKCATGNSPYPQTSTTACRTAATGSNSAFVQIDGSVTGTSCSVGASGTPQPTPGTGFVCTCGSGTGAGALPDGSSCVTTAPAGTQLVSLNWDANTPTPTYICKDGYFYSSTSKTCVQNAVTCPTARPYLYPIESLISDASATLTGLPCVASCPTGTTATTSSLSAPQVCVCSGTTIPNLQSGTPYSTNACHSALSCSATAPTSLDGSSCLTNIAACTGISNAAVLNNGFSCACNTGYSALPDGSACIATLTNAISTSIAWPNPTSGSAPDVVNIFQCKDGYVYSATAKTCNALSGSILHVSMVVAFIFTCLLLI